MVLAARAQSALPQKQMIRFYGQYCQPPLVFREEKAHADKKKREIKIESLS